VIEMIEEIEAIEVSGPQVDGRIAKVKKKISLWIFLHLLFFLTDQTLFFEIHYIRERNHSATRRRGQDRGEEGT